MQIKKHIKLSYSIYNISDGQKNKNCNRTSCTSNRNNNGYKDI